jgi:hypothetical protein
VQVTQRQGIVSSQDLWFYMSWSYSLSDPVDTDGSVNHPAALVSSAGTCNWCCLCMYANQRAGSVDRCCSVTRAVFHALGSP